MVINPVRIIDMLDMVPEVDPNSKALVVPEA